MRPREGVVRRGEPLRVDDESWFWTNEGARVESVDGREGVCRVCGRDIWGVSGCYAKGGQWSVERIMAGQIRRAGQASAQCSVLQPLVCHVPPVLGGLTFVSLVSLVSTPFVLTVDQSVSQSVSQSVVGWMCNSSQAGGKRK